MIWGTAFVAQKIGNGAIGPFLFVAARFLLSALLLAPLAMHVRRAGQHRLRRRDWLLARGYRRDLVFRRRQCSSSG